MSILEFCQWLQDTAIGTAIRESLWVFPIINAVHVLGLALSVGTIVWFDLRLLGLTLRRQSVSELWRQLMPWSIFGFVIMFASGGLLFWSEAVRAWSSVFFKAKVIFMGLAGLNALVYQLTLSRSMTEWDNTSIPLQARVTGLLSIIFWGIVIAAGRTMAYTF